MTINKKRMVLTTPFEDIAIEYLMPETKRWLQQKCYGFNDEDLDRQMDYIIGTHRKFREIKELTGKGD